MKKIFSFCNQKGGVGKTTSIVNISAALAFSGYRILVVDVDPQANATSGLGEEKPGIESTAYQLIVENESPGEIIRKTSIRNLDIVRSSADLSGAEVELVKRDSREYALKSQLDKLKTKYDFVLIDCPPSLGLITINALVASDFLIIPLQCEYYSLEGLGLLLNTFQLIRKELNRSLEIGGVLLTMADFRANLTQQVIDEVKTYFKEKVFQTIIPRSVKLSEAPSFGKPAILYDPSGRGSKSYKDVAEEFIERFVRKPKYESAAILKEELVDPSDERKIFPMDPLFQNQAAEKTEGEKAQ